jgi:hypothetical protein
MSMELIDALRTEAAIQRSKFAPDCAPLLEAAAEALAKTSALPLTDEQIKRMKPICADFVSFRAGVRAVEIMLGAEPRHR